MNDTQKLSITLFCSLVAVVVLSLYLLVNLSSMIIDSDFNTIAQISKDKESVILIGSSFLTGINSLDVQENLKNKEKNYLVFNLLVKGDTPYERKFSDLNKIIKLQPELVLYGIGIRDLDCKNLEKVKKAPLFAPNLEINTPKQFSIKFLKFASNQLNKQEQINNGYYPTYILPIDRIVNLKTYDYQIDEKLTTCILGKNYQVNSLIDNIKELKKNNIKVALFLVPHSNYFWEKVSTETKDSFQKTMKEITKANQINLYDLSYEFENENIFSEPRHVANNPEVKIYSEYIEKIILMELSDI